MKVSGRRARKQATRKGAERRSYQQFCGLARALDVVGERWTLLILRDLLLGPRRYGDLLEALPGITTNLLAKRLRELVDQGLVVKCTLPPPITTSAYALGDAGRALEPAIMALAAWGGRYMDAPRAEDRVDIGWGLLSLKRRYRGGDGSVVELAVGERRFTLRLDAERMGLEERAADRPALRLRAPLGKLQEAFFRPGGRDLVALADAGEVEVEGSRATLRTLARAFSPRTPPPGAGSVGAPS